MKKALSLALTITLLVCLAACKKEEAFEKGESLATIFAASDTHLLSEDLIDEGNVTYIKENFTNDGRIQECDYELMEALVETVNREKPDAMIFTGDLTFNGEKHSHEAFRSFIDRIDKDVTVLVIPGNHDMNIIDTRAYYNDTPHAELSVDLQEFTDIYADYGYKDAVSREKPAKEEKEESK